MSTVYTARRILCKERGFTIYCVLVPGFKE